ncbi:MULTISPECIES: hypothetical protein [Mycolicibacterium]|uniref:hypothetical protein n=1 Tax=Mycolicibacterium monacense TaxID=85693 RepID=UPI000B10B211|nr:hypothetical protein [Mycolicibacterium monacense]
MTLTDPREALADQSSFIGYLLGLTGVAHLVRALADDPRHHETGVPADDFVHLLLGFASIGRTIEHLGAPSVPPVVPTPSGVTQIRWLR